VANHDTPLNNTSGVLVVGSSGSLRLLGGSGHTAWSSNTNATTSSAPVVAQAQLLESGNLVVRDQSSGDVLWQWFDHPSNTFLAGMKFGKNLRTGAEWIITSWRASNDPAPGVYRRALDTRVLELISTSRPTGPLTCALIGGAQPIDGWWAPIAQCYKEDVGASGTRYEVRRCSQRPHLTLI
jgi:hypothetical protein